MCIVWVMVSSRRSKLCSKSVSRGGASRSERMLRTQLLCNPENLEAGNDNAREPRNERRGRVDTVEGASLELLE